MDNIENSLEGKNIFYSFIGKYGHRRTLEKIALAHFNAPSNTKPTLIDVGCGEGAHTDYFRKFGIETTGIDISPEDIDTAQKNFPHNSFICCDLNDRLPFDNCSFDYLFSNSVLQYIDWKKTICEYKRILKPNGKAVFIENLSGNPFTVTYRFFRHFSGYRKFLTPRKHIKYSELEFFKNHFNKVRFDFIDLTAPIAYFSIKLFRGNSNRKLLKICNKSDNFILTNFPIIQKYSWRVIIQVSNN